MGFHSPAVFFSFPLDKAVAIIFSLPQGLPVGAVTAPGVAPAGCHLELRTPGAVGCSSGSKTCRETGKIFQGERRQMNSSPGSVSDHVLSLLLDPPQATPKCWAETSSSGLMLQLFCSWPGGYPHPTLHWREEGQDLENSSWVISSTSSSDTHVETLNSSHLSHRKVFKCVGSHVVKQEQPACTVEISEWICCLINC